VQNKRKSPHFSSKTPFILLLVQDRSLQIIFHSSPAIAGKRGDKQALLLIEFQVW